MRSGKQTVVVVATLFIFLVSFVPPGFTGEESTVTISGHVQTLNIYTRSSGLKPETPANSADTAKEGSNLFASANRLRLEIKMARNFLDKMNKRRIARIEVNIHYDHTLDVGSYVNRGDSRIGRKIRHESQAIDLSESAIDENGLLYEHSLYRAYVSFRSDDFDADVGRQQIPWGVGRFVAPTDVFNPFGVGQLEWDERAGVDAVNIKTQLWDTGVNFVFTPRGGRLHPERYVTRLSRDVKGYELGFIAGRRRRDEIVGYDFRGNISDASIRSELLYVHARDEEDYLQYLFNIDYNFSNGIYALLEYYHNEQGKTDPSDYEISRTILGEIRQLGVHYTGLQLGYDITPLLRIESSTFFNLDDNSAFERLELTDSWTDNINLNVVAIVMIGSTGDEYGDKKNLYFVELERFF